MNVRKKLNVTTLFIINIIMLIVAVVPHHHHPNGLICLNQDQAIEQQAPTQHSNNCHSCCGEECLTHFQSSTPTTQSDNGPDFVLINVLFTEFMIEQSLQPLEKELFRHHVFRESLHSIKIPRTSSLRAPPACICLNKQLLIC